MKLLGYCEEELKLSFDESKLNLELKKNFKNLYLLNEDVKKSINDLLNGYEYITSFSGITFHLLNKDFRSCFWRARINIINPKTKLIIAWYEVEYDIDDNILDDYFDIL